jgi:hypothetical protein
MVNVLCGDRIYRLKYPLYSTEGCVFWFQPALAHVLMVFLPCHRHMGRQRIMLCWLSLLCLTGFHYLEMPGYDDGFPVLFENSLSQTRSVQVMQYLLDGSYLDASVSSHDSPGYFNGVCQWSIVTQHVS